MHAVLDEFHEQIEYDDIIKAYFAVLAFSDPSTILALLIVSFIQVGVGYSVKPSEKVKVKEVFIAHIM